VGRQPATRLPARATRLCAARPVQVASWSKAYQGPATSCAVSGLKPGRPYRLRVRAVNACGAGPFCEPATAFSQPAPPSAPGKPAFSQKTSCSVRAKWALPEEDFGAPVLAYTLQVAAPDGQYAEAYHGARQQLLLGQARPSCSLLPCCPAAPLPCCPAAPQPPPPPPPPPG
jgi:hypothetical protein